MLHLAGLICRLGSALQQVAMKLLAAAMVEAVGPASVMSSSRPRKSVVGMPSERGAASEDLVAAAIATEKENGARGSPCWTPVHDERTGPDAAL